MGDSLSKVHTFYEVQQKSLIKTHTFYEPHQDNYTEEELQLLH